MPRFMLAHRHRPDECAVVFEAWKGVQSRLRHRAATASCALVDVTPRARHEIWWQVEAKDELAALALLPPYVAERTEVAPISEVPIP